MKTPEENISKWVDDGNTRSDIARKLFLILPTVVFLDKPDDQYRVYSQLCAAFSMPISSIEIVGSAKTGFSLWKGHLFAPGTSDLDIGIVDGTLFLKMFEAAFSASKGFSDESVFSSKKDANQFKWNLNHGICVPRLMPRCPEKTKWLLLFGALSRENKNLFSSVSAYIYASEKFFEMKQIAAIDKFLAQKGIE